MGSGNLPNNIINRSNSNLSITGFILSVLGIIIPLVSIAGIIVSLAAIFKNQGKRVFAITGLILGIIAFVIQLIIILIALPHIKSAGLIPGSDYVSVPFYLSSSTISPESLQIEIKNNGNQDITIKSFSVSFNEPIGASCNSAPQLSTSLKIGKSTVLLLGGCSGLKSGEKVNANILINYNIAGSDLKLISTGILSKKL